MSDINEEKFNEILSKFKNGIQDLSDEELDNVIGGGDKGLEKIRAFLAVHLGSKVFTMDVRELMYNCLEKLGRENFVCRSLKKYL